MSLKEKNRTVATVLGSLVALIAALALVTGCSQDDHGTGDAPVKGHKGDDTAVQVYNFPDQFANVGTKCVGAGFRAFVTTREAAPVVLADPACK